MSKGQYLSGYQQGIVKRFYDNQDTLVVQKLAELSSELYLLKDAAPGSAESKKSAAHWKSVATALKKSTIDPMRAARIVNERKVEDLAKVVQELSAPGAKVVPDKPRFGASAAQGPVPASPPPSPAAPAPAATAPSAPVSPAAPPSPDTLKSALHAFKKRLKVTRLDEESKISNRALTGGKKSAIVAIQPPREYPRAVWEALVAEGKLKYSGSGMYELVE